MPWRLVNFINPQLKSHYEASLLEASGFSPEEREINALVAVHGRYYDLEGPENPTLHDLKWRMLLPRLRVELRRWCRNPRLDKSAAAQALREYLSRFLAEKF